MIKNNPYKPEKVKLSVKKKLILIFAFIGSGIYSIIVGLILFYANIPEFTKLVVTFIYIITGPLIIYMLWLLVYFWKREKWPQNKTMFGERFKFFLIFFLIGICITSWAAYWNSGIDTFWMIGANIIYYTTKNLLLTEVYYVVGATAITPALVEEFMKSLPSIMAFFVVLQRKKNPDQKRKGLLGNEFNGFLIGLIVGMAFEVIELIYYLMLVSMSGGALIDFYIQVTVRDWAPIHLLGGAVGGFAAGRAERLRFEKNEEDTPISSQIFKFIKRFVPFWLVPVTMHFLWNSSSVWIFLYLYLTNNLNEVLYQILEIVVIVCLSVICFLLLLLFLRKANKVAKNANRCPETGIIVSKEGLICETISDSFSSESVRPSFEGDTKIQHVKFCPTCGVQVNVNQNFCTNCGTSFAFLKRRFSIIRHRRDDELYNQASKQLIIISIVFSNIFLFISIALFILVALTIGIYSLYYFFALIIFELITGILLLYASINLLILRKKYNGSKNVFYWLILIINSIGMFGMFLLTGISFIFLGSLILLGIGILFMVGSVVVLVFLIRGLLKGNQIMQYQREI